jgi:all-trans-retinol 13,14-reductase
LLEKLRLEVLQSITDNKELIAVLTGQYGDYGMPPSKSSFAIHATVAKHYLGGGAYPVGGSAEIYNTIAPQILKNGSQVLVSAAVEQIVLKNGKAIGVQMKDGKNIYADMVISGAGLHNTFLKLLPEEALSKIPFRKEITQLKPSHGHLSLYIGLKKTTEELGITKANIWYYPTGNDHDAAVETFLNDPFNQEIPVVYMSFPSAKDPDFKNRYPGKSTIELVTVIPNDLFAKWEGTRWKKRGDDYEELKEYFCSEIY